MNLLSYVKQHIWVTYLFGFVIISGFGLIIWKANDLKETKPVSLKSIHINHVIDGHNMVESETIRRNIEEHFNINLLGTTISQLSLDAIEKLVEEDPFVKDAEVYINAGNQLEVDVWQRDPIMRVMDNEGFSYYIDQFKHRVPFSKLYTARVPVVTGNFKAFPESDIEKWDEIQRAVYEIVLHSSNDKMLSALISQIHVNKDSEISMFPVIGDEEIIFGDANRIEDKLENLKVFYKNGLRDEGWKTYDQIDLRYKDLVFGKKKKLKSNANNNIDKS